MLTLGQGFAFDALEPRADGFVALRFVLTKPSVVPYQLKNGRTVRALKAPEDWTGEPFLVSARSVPITIEHPKKLVTPASAREVMVGLADSVPAVVRDSLVFHGATLHDQTAIDGTRTKRWTAVSAGTHVDWVENSGVWVAADGTSHPYDLIQKNPRLNHIALTAHPRVQASRILSLDSDIDAVFVPDTDTMDELKELLAKLSLDSTAVAALTKLVSDRDASLAELSRTTEALRGERDSLRQKLADAPSLDSLTDRVSAELTQIAEIAAKVPGLAVDSLAKAKTTAERYVIALDALKVKVDPKAGEDYLRGRFEGAIANPIPENPVVATIHPNSARAALINQEHAPRQPTPAERIAAAKERDARRSRGEKV